MLLKALICGCLVFGLATSAPQRGRIGLGSDNADVNNQYDGGNNQYDSGSSGNNQYNSGSNQYDSASNQYNNAGISGRQYDDSRYARIIKYDSDNDGTGNYAYEVSQSDGIYEDQVGEFRDHGNDEEDETRVYGHYGYPGPDGKFYYTEYVADKNGFRPAGDHIPRAASVGRVGQLGIPSAAIASLAGGGLG